MSEQNEHRIRERAYALWVEEGRPEGRHAEHWYTAVCELMTKAGDQLRSKTQKSKNEGEGNVTAARAYNAETRKFIKSGRVASKAQEAKKAIEGPEGPSLRQAEAIGKRRARSSGSAKA
jgi:hypothetical protein